MPRSSAAENGKKCMGGKEVAGGGRRWQESKGHFDALLRRTRREREGAEGDGRILVSPRTRESASAGMCRIVCSSHSLLFCSHSHSFTVNTVQSERMILPLPS